MLYELGWEGLLKTVFKQQTFTSQGIQLKAQSIYQVKRKTELLGINVQRVVSTQQPQEFLILEGVPPVVTQTLLQGNTDLNWANTTANQLLKLREENSDKNPVSVEIQKLKAVPQAPILLQGKPIPYWQMDVQFKLSNEPMPRHYRAGLLYPFQGKASKKSQLNVLVVGYAAKSAYEKRLLVDLMQQVRWPEQRQ